MSVKPCQTRPRPDTCIRVGRCMGDDCPTCNGEGMLEHPEKPSAEKWECPDCDGTGKADFPFCGAMRNNY